MNEKIYIDAAALNFAHRFYIEWKTGGVIGPATFVRRTEKGRGPQIRRFIQFVHNAGKSGEVDISECRFYHVPPDWSRSEDDGSEFDALAQDYLAWVRATFPDETPEQQMTHFLEECAELHAQPERADEYADVLMLLLTVAANNGVDVLEEFRKKLAVNKARRWVKTERGYRHE